MNIKQRAAFSMKMAFILGFFVGLEFMRIFRDCFLFWFGMAISLLSMAGFIVHLWDERKDAIQKMKPFRSIALVIDRTKKK